MNQIPISSMERTVKMVRTPLKMMCIFPANVGDDPQGSWGKMAAVARLIMAMARYSHAPMTPNKADCRLVRKYCSNPIPNRINKREKVAWSESSKGLLGEPGENSSLTVFATWLYPGLMAPPRTAVNMNSTGATIPPSDRIL